MLFSCFAFVCWTWSCSVSLLINPLFNVFIFFLCLCVSLCVKPDQIGGDPGRRQSSRNSCGPLLLFPQWTVSNKLETWERRNLCVAIYVSAIQFANLNQSYTSCLSRNGNTDGICERYSILARQHTDTVAYTLEKVAGKRQRSKNEKSQALLAWSFGHVTVWTEGEWGFPKGRQDSFLQMFLTTHLTPVILPPGQRLPWSVSVPLSFCPFLSCSTCPLLLSSFFLLFVLTHCYHPCFVRNIWTRMWPTHCPNCFQILPPAVAVVTNNLEQGWASLFGWSQYSRNWMWQRGCRRSRSMECFGDPPNRRKICGKKTSKPLNDSNNRKNTYEVQLFHWLLMIHRTSLRSAGWVLNLPVPYVAYCLSLQPRQYVLLPEFRCLYSQVEKKALVLRKIPSVTRQF